MMRAFLAMAAGVCLAVMQAAPDDEPATAALQRKLDDQARTLANVVAAVEQLELRPADAATVTASSLGAKPDDGVDDAPLLQAALDQMLNVELDRTGLYEIGTPLRTVAGQSNVIKGQSAGYRHTAKSVTGLKAIGNVTHLIELPGEAGKGNGQGQVIRDLYLQGNENCDGVRILGCRNASIENCVIRSCKRGVAIEPVVSVYCPSVANTSILGCDVGIELKNATTVCCFRADAVEVTGGRIGVLNSGWKRGAVFTGVVCEGQTEACWKLDGGHATLIGCYAESSGVATLWLRSARATLIDCVVHGVKYSKDSNVCWLGENLNAFTLAWP